MLKRFIRQIKKESKKEKNFEIIKICDTNTVTIGDKPRFKADNIIRFWGHSSNNQVNIGKNFQAKDLKIVFKGSHNQLIIDDNVRWTGSIIISGSNRTVRIGKNSTAQGVYILSKSEDISIGKNCMLSRQIEIRSTDVHKIFSRESGHLINPAKPVVIDDGVWIAAKATLSKGAIIPKGSVVGAASFVNKAFHEKNTIIAGVPAKVVKSNIRWER